MGPTTEPVIISTCSPCVLCIQPSEKCASLDIILRALLKTLGQHTWYYGTYGGIRGFPLVSLSGAQWTFFLPRLSVTRTAYISTQYMPPPYRLAFHSILWANWEPQGRHQVIFQLQALIFWRAFKCEPWCWDAELSQTLYINNSGRVGQLSGPTDCLFACIPPPSSPKTLFIRAVLTYRRNTIRSLRTFIIISFKREFKRHLIESLNDFVSWTDLCIHLGSRQNES